MDRMIVAMYLRLSNEDSDKGKFEESNSISAQRVLLKKHIEELLQGQEYSITEFCDDGYSGVDFRRPGVQALIEAAKSGNINMVIVKDFSRFGRDYLEVGRFLEYIFPILQIRFVSVNDSYDSDDKFGATGGMSVALKNLVYAMYSADLSKKVRTARDTRVRNGEFVGQFAPYGYRKNPEDKHKLLVDEDSAWVVQKIFGMAADGISYAEIARRLNEERIPSRVVYHKLIGDTYGDRQPHVKVKRWCASSVRDIITDEVYLGKLIWNRAKCGMDTDKKVVKQPKEKWIVVEGHHEALISQSIFDKANAGVGSVDTARKEMKKRNSLFFCGHCGKTLQLRSRANGRYFCRSRTQERENDCQKVNVRREDLEEAVLCQVRKMADMLTEEKDIRWKTHKDGRKAVLETIVADSTKEMARWKGTKMHLYEQYKAREISRENYLDQIEKGKVWLKELEREKGEAQAELDRMQAVSGSEGIVDEELVELSELEIFDKDRLKTLIEKVVVYEEDAMEIVWKVENPFRAENSA